MIGRILIRSYQGVGKPRIYLCIEVTSRPRGQEDHHPSALVGEYKCLAVYINLAFYNKGVVMPLGIYCQDYCGEIAQSSAH